MSDLSEYNQIQCDTRTDEVVLTRLRIGHSRLTHSHLMKGEGAAVAQLVARWAADLQVERSILCPGCVSSKNSPH
jgi:hypothetical protein